MRRHVAMLLLVVFMTGPVFGHETAETSNGIAFEEKLGQQIPAKVLFLDENGTTIDLNALVDKPTIIAPVYFRCAHICPLLLTGLADVLGKLEIVRPGKDFQVITLSFDEKDTPALAREKKKNYLAAIGKPFPEDAWKFLTGDAANIQKFTESVGFKFQRDSKDFSHLLTLIFIAPGGKIVRYLYGVSFLPFTVTMAITEAAQGRIGSTAGRVLTYCFSYDPQKKSYVFNILRVTGAVMILFVVSFFAYLMISTKKKRGAAQ